MNRELFAKLYNDDCFKTFCNQIDQLRKQGYEITLPLETTTLLFGSGIGYIKENSDILSLQHFTTFSRLTTPIYKLLKGLFNGDIIF